MLLNGINSTARPDFDVVLPHSAFSIIGCIWMTLTVVLILTFTPISLVVIYRVTSIQRTTKLFMTSLTVADLGNGLFWALPKLTENIAGRWVLGDGMCKLYGVGYRTFVSLSVFSLVLLNIDRYIAIVYSLRYFRIVTVRRTLIVVVFTWAVSWIGGVSAFGFVIYRVVSEIPPYLCVWKEDGLHQLTVVCILFTSLLIMLGLYAHILVIARRQARRIARETQPLGPRRDNGLRLRLKSATTVFLITGAVSLSWIPQIVIGATDLQTSRESRIFTDTLFMTNSWLNVVIYSFRNKGMRLCLRGIVCQCRRLCSFQRGHAVADVSN